MFVLGCGGNKKHHISCLDGRLLMNRFGMKPPVMKPDIASSEI
jgi:hypothetical protein